MRPGTFSPGILAALALAAGDAAAVALNPSGVGEALIYPYYTVNAGQDTLVTVDNVSDIGKAVKVFIREGANGREVMDFNLFLAPHDSWSGVISSSGEGALARIGTGDHSCIDFWSSNPQPFSTSAFDGTFPHPGSPPSAWATPDRTREGMIEIINGGDIVPGSPLDLATRPTADGGAPSCAGTNDTFFDRYVQAPTDGLVGSAAIANVAQGTFFPYTAIALSGFSDRQLFNSIVATVWTGLDAANSSGTANGGAFAHLVTGDGEPLTLEYARGIDAVSAVFMADRLYNEYLVNADLGAATDWVVTFPTREFYVDKQYFPGNVTAPFEAAAGDYWSPVTTGFATYDREALTSFWYCPPLLPGCFPQFGYQINVVPIGFTDTSLVLASALTAQQSLPPESSSGHVELDLDPEGTHVLAGGKATDGTTVDLHGLPVTGFMVYNVINTQAQPGRLANYGGLFPHRTTMGCWIRGSDYTTFCP